MLVDTYSVDGRAKSWRARGDGAPCGRDTIALQRAACVCCRREQEYLTQWAAAIEAAGFVFLRHVTLPRSHALAFATTSGGGGGDEEPPELHMKREQREQGWELSSIDGGDGV